MTTKLSAELQQALDEQGGTPIKVVHPVTNQVYLLIAAEQYERLKPLFEEDPMSEQEQRFLLQQAGKRAGWDDPEMDAYDNYDAHRPQP
ncbi:MAG: hypothetical protein HY000_02950 [Planctomycetes bacterium]|nr:hypothetical protein [Planctomycetota bacterium]